MRIYKTTIVLATAASVLALGACNEALVPDYNTPTGYPHGISSLQSEFTGVLTRIRVDQGFYDLAMEGFARNSAYYTPSEDRFVTQLTGDAPLDDDNFGAGIWPTPFEAVKDADSLQAVLRTVTNTDGSALPAANTSALSGVVLTMKALDYMYVAISHDTNGVAMNSPGQPFSGNLAPILCARDSWKEIVAMLDSAVTDLKTAGASTVLGYPGTQFSSVTVPPGMSSVGGTAGAWLNFTLALRGRARVEYAYAIARGPGGSAPTTTSAGAPDQSQLDSAITDITSSNLYSTSLSPAEAVAANDIGVFHTYNASGGDFSNPIFPDASAIFVLEGAAQQIDTLHDQRFLAKFAQAPQQPTTAGASKASSYAYFNNIGLATPIPITRNLHLQFLLARAYLGTNQLVKAAQTVDAVRTNVGGLASGLGSVNTSSYPSVRDFMMREMIPTLIDDGEGEQVASIRDLGLIMVDLTTWGSADQHTTMENIPSVERQQRNNSYQPVCP